MVSILFPSSFHPTFGDGRFPASFSGADDFVSGLEGGER